MQLLEEFLTFKIKEAAIMETATSAIAEVHDDLGRCDALLSLLDSIG